MFILISDMAADVKLSAPHDPCRGDKRAEDCRMIAAFRRINCLLRSVWNRMLGSDLAWLRAPSLLNVTRERV
ncbi:MULTISPECIES: hypothetical protein [Bosea]|uniref:hypothetical protein n=1 Tax=Bosea TaxID=85413 RepID=UPI00214FAF8D|nr:MULTISPECIES: hypothetical protein [Bosea]MCR4522370.1 hypothetical protein [Bosea sp. 47.2.35]MDR6829161.1 hypothetical protein [Bosea robiniae]MDR6896045.1 hypothetical protein [Bosea sp. BE109]MDR7139442.1 hypothetical protein [Bosea sp. BE168]MDR7176140.1 hypothetical protein [Bosea sp. BE271]